MLSFPLDVPQFFFDDVLVAEQQRLVRRWLPAAVFPEPLIRPDKPWEGRALVLYGSVLENPAGGYRMYYSCFRPGIGAALFMMATSRDGFNWEKPALGLVEYEGNRENNILLVPEGPFDSPSVIYDAEDSAFPYKMLCFRNTSPPPMWAEDWGMYAYQSRDGIHWEGIPGARIRMGDRSSFLKDPVSGCYQLYTRDPEMFPQAGGRHISRSKSDDFVNWTAPELLLAPDLSDEPDIEFYGMPIFVRHGWYFGLLEYWDSARDVIEVHMAISRDGTHWQRPQRTPFVAASYPWNRAWTTCANNGPVVMKEEMVFYLGGRAEAHGWGTATQHGVIGYATLPVDRFCALEGKAGGTMTTVPFIWPGGTLVVNCDTRESFSSHPGHANGELRVEVLDKAGQPLPDWGGEQAAIFHGNTHCRGGIHGGEILWSQGRSLADLCGKPVRLRFSLRHARLFTICARSEKK